MSSSNSLRTSSDGGGGELKPHDQRATRYGDRRTIMKTEDPRPHQERKSAVPHFPRHLSKKSRQTNDPPGRRKHPGGKGSKGSQPPN